MIRKVVHHTPVSHLLYKEIHAHVYMKHTFCLYFQCERDTDGGSPRGLNTEFNLNHIELNWVESN